MNQGTLVIKLSKPSDAGVFQCFAYNHFGKAVTQKTEIVASSK